MYALTLEEMIKNILIAFFSFQVVFTEYIWVSPAKFIGGLELYPQN